MRVIPTRTKLAILSAIAATTIMPARAQDKPLPESCHDLWVERNTYYKDAGYCFRTKKAQEYFHDAMRTCTIQRESEVTAKLTPEQLKRIAALTRRERQFGCE